MLTQILCWLLISGLYYEWVAIAAGILYILARIGYTIGYIHSPKMRAPGLMISMLSVLVLHVMSYVAIGTMLYEMNPYLY